MTHTPHERKESAKDAHSHRSSHLLLSHASLNPSTNYSANMLQIDWPQATQGMMDLVVYLTSSDMWMTCPLAFTYKTFHSSAIGGAIIKKLASFRHKTQKFFFFGRFTVRIFWAKDTNGVGLAGRPILPIFQNPKHPLLIEYHQYHPPGNKSA